MKAARPCCSDVPWERRRAAAPRLRAESTTRHGVHRRTRPNPEGVEGGRLRKRSAEQALRSRPCKPGGSSRLETTKPSTFSSARRTPFRRSRTRSVTSRAGPGRSSLCRSNSTSETCRRVDDRVGNATTPALRVRRRGLRCRDLHDVGRTGSRRSHASALDDRPRAYAARRRSMAGDRRDRALRDRRDRRGGDPDDLGRMEPRLAAR
jgi:hypothetical protein